MAFIEVKNIRKSYQFGKNNSVEILKGVNLDIEYGEFVALVGSSGSGKSTLLYIMGLLDQANEGKVIIHGHSMLEMTSTEQTNARLKYLGYVFQDFNLIPELTITENLESLGVEIYSQQIAANLPSDTDLLIYTEAVPATNPERQQADKLGSSR